MKQDERICLKQLYEVIANDMDFVIHYNNVSIDSRKDLLPEILRGGGWRDCDHLRFLANKIVDSVDITYADDDPEIPVIMISVVDNSDLEYFCPYCNDIVKAKYISKPPHVGAYCKNCGRYLKWESPSKIKHAGYEILEDVKDENAKTVSKEECDDECPF